MDLSKFSIKQIEEMFAEGSNLEDLVDACRQDSRTACSRLVRRFERLEAEKQRLWGMYQYERDAWEDGLDMWLAWMRLAEDHWLALFL